MKTVLEKDEYPYERFEKYGAAALSDAELLAIIIRTGTVGEDALSLARKILQLSEEGMLSLYSVSLEELQKIKGIGKVKAIRIKCIAEFCKRMSMYHRQTKLNLNKPQTIAEYYMESMRHLETEHVVLLITDNKNKLVKECLISKGSVNTSIVSTREIFIEALRYQAVHIFLLHNHPSGDPTPSRQDIVITKTLLQASQLMNIPLVDHIIIGDNKYISLKEQGYL